MHLRLSVVDQLPVHSGGNGVDATKNAVQLARVCDDLGFHRYWIAEHHNTPSYACPCPEILIGQIASVTKHMRIGSGGVMLSHYSPYKVAEIFKMLATLHPGRIDLGIGRAPGGDELASEALAFPSQRLQDATYEELAGLLTGLLSDQLPVKHRFAPLRVMPCGPHRPQQWMLGSGYGSAELAGELGMGFALALFIGTHERPAEIFQQYRQARSRAGYGETSREMLAVAVICAPSIEEARYLAASHTYWKVMAFRHGIRGALVPPAEALSNRSRLSPSDRAYFDETMDSIICGPASHCLDQLQGLSRKYGVDEISVVNVTYEFEARLRSYRMLAEGCGLVKPARVDVAA